jgi:hypothetical protein
MHVEEYVFYTYQLRDGIGAGNLAPLLSEEG